MIRILLIDDHAVVRTGYRRLLSAEHDLQVVGEAASADEANALVNIPAISARTATVSACLGNRNFTRITIWAGAILSARRQICINSPAVNILRNVQR